jgi:hypothetical protein
LDTKKMIGDSDFMKNPVRILLQTTIPATENDWGIERFALLHQYLTSLQDKNGEYLFDITSRNRETGVDGNDPVLSHLENSGFDELWLFAVDTGNGLTEKECQSIKTFWQQGGGVFTTRDHQDLGSSLCGLGVIGAAHHFHSRQCEPDESRHVPDDIYTTNITWPNYNSGRNGDYQVIKPAEPLHPLLYNPASPSGIIEFLPAHPHEGAVGVPAGATNAQVVATGQSVVTGRSFNLLVAFDRSATAAGRAIADSSFHHLVDYNWDTTLGCPSFVGETCGDTILTTPRAMEDTKAYARNMAIWLAPAS